MRRIYFFLPVLILALFGTSCSYFKRSTDTKLIYTVKSNTLNVRQASNTNSKVLGQLQKGDTIFPTHDFLYWIEFEYKDGKAWVNADYLVGHRIANMERVSNMQLDNTATIIRDLLNKYVNWRSWMFWAIALGAIGVIWILMAIGRSIDDATYWDGAEYEYGKLPYFSAFIGALFSVVYMYSREDVLQALFVTKLWWIPDGKEWIPWYLWTISIVGVLGLLFFWFQYFKSYGSKGIVRLIYYTLVSVVSFIAGIFWGIVGVIFGIVYLLLSLSEGFKSTGGQGSTYTSSPARGPTEEERLQEFYRQKEYDEKVERRRLLDELEND